MSTTSPSPDTTAATVSEGFQPIGSYGLLADCNSAALVDRDGSVGWLCLPRYDSPAVFSQILDPNGGHWRIRPAGEYRSERRYIDGTLVIESTFTAESGSVKVTDAMAFAEGQRHHELGMDSPHLLLRSVEGISGEVAMELELAPRPEYGLVKPLFRQTESGGRTFGGPNQVVFSSADDSWLILYSELCGAAMGAGGRASSAASIECWMCCCRCSIIVWIGPNA